jgi:Chs5-Arf1p-binding protein BUD7/BCH1
MFTFNGRDAHRNLSAMRLHLPVKAAVAEILPEREKTEDDEADPALQRLPAPGLRGTWARAYALLTRLVSQIGWDELLKTRSAVFVMEEEYRMQKAHADIAATVQEEEAVADDDASTKGVRAPPSPSREHTPTSSAVQSPTIAPTDDAESTIPTIRISTESSREESLRAEKAAAAAKVNGKENANAVEGLQQPAQAAASEGDGESKDATTGGQESFSFSNKRLCERWLDNLFMVLYEVSERHVGPALCAANKRARISVFGRSSAQK